MPRNQNPSLSKSDPLRTAWRVLGQDAVSTSRKNLFSYCGRCGLEENLTPLKEIVSNNFTGWGTVNPATSGFCDSCAWGYRDERLRFLPMIVSLDGNAIFASNKQVATLLSYSLSPDFAISVPFLGKKHLLPHAEWGKVVSDDGALSWRSAEAGLIEVFSHLRAFNIYESEFLEPAPPFRAVLNLSSDTNAILELMNWWEKLIVWQRSPYFRVALRATREDYNSKNNDSANAGEE